MHSKHDIFLKSLEEAHSWLNDTCFYAELQEKFQGLLILRVVLHELRDHLTLSASSKLSAQLPLLIRGLYFENWDIRHGLLEENQHYFFIDSITEKLKKYISIEGEKASVAVFKVLAKHTALERSYKLEKFFPPGIFSVWIKALQSPKA